MIPNKEMYAKPNFKYYTDILRGQYFTIDPQNPQKITLFTRQRKMRDGGKNTSNYKIDNRTMAVIMQIISYCNRMRPSNLKGSRPNTIPRCADYNPIYEEIYFKQIIKYHQLLLVCKSEVSLCLRVGC